MYTAPIEEGTILQEEEEEEEEMGMSKKDSLVRKELIRCSPTTLATGIVTLRPSSWEKWSIFSNVAY